jgi:hypothetical protein
MGISLVRKGGKGGEGVATEKIMYINSGSSFNENIESEWVFF